MSDPQDPDVKWLGELAREALKDKLDRATSAELAAQEGIQKGLELGLARAQDNAAAERWDRIVGAVERVVDKVFDRLDRVELRRMAAENPPPTTDDDDDERSDVTKEQADNVLAAIAQRGPPRQVAELLLGVGVTSASFDTTLAEFRRGSEEWAAHLDADPEWVASVKRELDELDGAETPTG